MFRHTRLKIGALVLILTGCAPTLAPAPLLPTIVAPSEIPAPTPAGAYPTAEASSAGTSQTVSGFGIELVRAWRDGKQVHAEVCFGLPDSSDWTVWEAHFEYGGTSVSEFSASYLRNDSGQSGQASRRCDELTFFVPPDADLSASSLTVESVGAYPTADEYCSLYLPKIQQAMSERATGITVDCPVVDGQPTLQITAKPEAMSQEEAEQLVFSDEFYTVHGPWSFPVTFRE